MDRAPGLSPASLASSASPGVPLSSTVTASAPGCRPSPSYRHQARVFLCRVTLTPSQDSRAWSGGAGCFLNRGLSARDPVLTVGYLAPEPLLVARLPLGSGAQ
ncbi:hypothetical protein J1605_022502 [Eschrichtius robustus]|uniref:Uncharacterized protein n=1 Tax=Eschrichtius robustus TaxID=9764 RepID=A0AB34HA62_ESCRO|nr:hypothetical protein J1605_022502 [Eschrichtius robustus]